MLHGGGFELSSMRDELLKLCYPISETIRPFFFESLGIEVIYSWVSECQDD